MTRQRVAASIAIAWCAVSLAAARQQRPDPAQWVPADAVAYVGIADPAALLSRFEKTAARSILSKASQLGGPLKQVAELGDELRRRLSALLGLKPNELATPRGPIAFYLTPSPDGSTAAHFVLIFGIDDNDANRARYATALDRLSALDRDHSATRRDAWTIDTLRRRSAQRSPDATAIRKDEDVNPFGLDAAAFGDRSSERLGQWFSPEAMPDTIAMCHAGTRIIISDSVLAVESALSLTDVNRSLNDIRRGSPVVGNQIPDFMIGLLVLLAVVSQNGAVNVIQLIKLADILALHQPTNDTQLPSCGSICISAKDGDLVSLSR
ncbi:MAG: hypothetical protein IID33_16545, partial [Planctomycetes bacterium]|nr:hypothetical protein [Planctomycetota bacterium]